MATTAQSILRVMSQANEPLTAKSLSNMSGKGMATVASALSHLQKKKLVKKAGKDPLNKKASMFQLTPEGEQTHQQAPPTAPDVSNDVEQLKLALAGIVTAVTKALNDYSKLKKRLAEMSKL